MIYAKINSKSYGEKLVLNDLEITINKGDFISLVGESGCGKTTLLNILAGFDKNYDGNVSLKGTFSVVFQNHVLLEMLTVYENLKLIDKNLSEEEIDNQLIRLGIYNIKHNRIQCCSVGELQRVMIVRAILSGSDIIFADEPTAALDFKSSQKIMSIFQELNEKGMTILLITHSIYCAAYAKKVLLLKDKNITETLALTNNISNNTDLIYAFVTSRMDCIF